MNKSYVKIFSIAGGIIVSALGFGLYSLYSKRNTNYLNESLEQYCQEVENKLKCNKDSRLSIDIIASIINLITEIEDYTYNSAHFHLEDKRISLMNNSTEYEQCINESLELHEKTFAHAIKIVEKRLQLNFGDIQKEIIYYSRNKKEYAHALENNQKVYDDLPLIQRDRFKQAFLNYAKSALLKDKLSKQLLHSPTVKNEYKDVVVNIYILNKYLLGDELRKEYGISEKYIFQLLKKHNLLDDPDVIKHREELLNL